MKSLGKEFPYIKKTKGVWSRLLSTAILWSVLLILFSVINRRVGADTANIERASLGTNHAQSNEASYYLFFSENANLVTFESFNVNWWPDQTGVNYIDIFVRDRMLDMTTKISNGYDGSPSDQRSFDPMLSANGRYVSFNSYATNLVPNDTNRHSPIDDGLDLFLYDRQSGTLQRISLNWLGQQIDANSVGNITPDAHYAIFTSNGDQVVQNDSNPQAQSAIYKRDIQSGAIERISKGEHGGYPEGGIGGADASFDGRYITYITDAENLVPNDTNGFPDIMLFDSVTKQTIIVSKPIGGGQSNGMSSPADISNDGRYVVFRSFASNLVPGDVNNQADIFVYSIMTGELELVSVSSTGALGNGESKDPGICGNGRFVVFTSEATNLVPQPHNGYRQIYVHDRLRHETFLASINSNGEMGNGRGHRGSLSADCSTVGYATDASNLVLDDTNGKRDLFLGRIMYPADLTSSSISARGTFEAGQAITYTITLHNTGTESIDATFTNPVPSNTTYLPGSLSGVGAVYNNVLNTIEWNGNVSGESELSFSYVVVINSGVADFTLITNQGTLIEKSVVHNLEITGIVNGLKLYFPVVAKN